MMNLEELKQAKQTLDDASAIINGKKAEESDEDPSLNKIRWSFAIGFFISANIVWVAALKFFPNFAVPAFSYWFTAFAFLLILGIDTYAFPNRDTLSRAVSTSVGAALVFVGIAITVGVGLLCGAGIIDVVNVTENPTTQQPNTIELEVDPLDEPIPGMGGERK